MNESESTDEVTKPLIRLAKSLYATGDEKNVTITRLLVTCRPLYRGHDYLPGLIKELGRSCRETLSKRNRKELSKRIGRGLTETLQEYAIGSRTMS